MGRGLLIGVGSIDWFRCPLPPNRTCEFPAYGSPVGGFTHEGTDRPGHGRPASCRAQTLQSRHSPPLTPSSRAVSIRAVQTVGSVHDQSRARPAVLGSSPARLALSGTPAGVFPSCSDKTSPPSCTPSLHRRYPASSLL